MSNKNAKPENGFEANLEALERLVEQMESGELELEALIQRYEEGSKLLRRCESQLKSAEKRIELLKNQDGEPEFEDFAPESSK